jgi:hypothetical protein
MHGESLKMNRIFLQPIGIKKLIQQPGWILFRIIFLSKPVFAQLHDSPLQKIKLNGFSQTQLIGGLISYFIDSSESSDLKQIHNHPFLV